ncbi:c-type cytochrome [Dongia deserti]|uniref:c-type cytochrome n=1 Tax=Dongia deserti TaxID=2268030 RepID=UPI002547B356|nr:c-type cytochrome [Dongia deserti]
MHRSFGLMLVALSFACVPGAFAANAVRGEEIYNSRCIACHSPDANRVGPKHRGVVGRKAGSLADFNSSKAVRTAGVVWDEETLDQWLADPQGFIPGQRMNFKVTDPTDRADLIAYLKTLQ